MTPVVEEIKLNSVNLLIVSGGGGDISEPPGWGGAGGSGIEARCATPRHHAREAARHTILIMSNGSGVRMCQHCGTSFLSSFRSSHKQFF